MPALQSLALGPPPLENSTHAALGTGGGGGGWALSLPHGHQAQANSGRVPSQPCAQPPTHTCLDADPRLSTQDWPSACPSHSVSLRAVSLGTSHLSVPLIALASCDTLCGQEEGDKQHRRRPHLWSSGGEAQHPRLGGEGPVLPVMGQWPGSEAGRALLRERPARPPMRTGAPPYVGSFGKQTVSFTGRQWGLSAGTALPHGAASAHSLVARTEASGAEASMRLSTGQACTATEQPECPRGGGGDRRVRRQPTSAFWSTQTSRRAQAWAGRHPPHASLPRCRAGSQPSQGC